MTKKRTRKFRGSKSKNRKRKNFIYKDDICFFKKGTPCYMPNDDGSYNPNLTRTIWPGEHVVFKKRFRDSRDGTWKFLIEVYGQTYIHFGTMKDLTKNHIKYQQTYEEVSQ